jgi:uncharacterized protein YndB with AHSA1/START domain
MPYSFTLTTTIPASPQEVYEAWLDSLAHSEMTGGAATMSNEVGAEVSAWDTYITGRNLELVPGERIVQTWRTSEFGDEHEDSIVTLTLEPVEEGTLLTLEHTNVPDEQRSYEENGWQENYFEPMIAYFSERRPAAEEGEEEGEEAEDAEESEGSEEEAMPVAVELPLEIRLSEVEATATPEPRLRRKPKAAKGEPEAKAPPKKKAASQKKATAKKKAAPKRAAKSARRAKRAAKAKPAAPRAKTTAKKRKTSRKAAGASRKRAKATRGKSSRKRT